MKLIEVENLWKRYPYDGKSDFSLKSILFNKKRTRYTGKTIDVFKGISFSVEEGETLGVLGFNGAGKTTLLKILAGITPYDSGNIKIKGKVHAILGLGNSFHPYLTGRENAERELKLFGLWGKSLNQAIEYIEDFAELGKYFGQPIQVYSTGMVARLAFSVATSFQPQIFLIDEVLAVGDRYFAMKSLQRIKELVRQGTTTIIVSHQWIELLQICDKLLWLGDGVIKENGEAIEIARKFVLQNKLVTLPESRDLRLIDCDIQNINNDLIFKLSIQGEKIPDDIEININFIKFDPYHKVLFTMKVIGYPENINQNSRLLEIPIKSNPLGPGNYLISILLKTKNIDVWEKSPYEHHNWMLSNPIWIKIPGEEKMLLRKKLKWFINSNG